MEFPEAVRKAVGWASSPSLFSTNRGLEAHATGLFGQPPSQHDGKDAAMLAELGAIGKSVPWPSMAISETTAKLKAQVQWLTAQQEIWQTWQGRLEGLISKFWPEATSVMSLQSATLLRVLREYGGPRGLAADVEATLKLAKWGRQRVDSKKVASLLASARETQGVRMTKAEEEYVKRCANAAFEAGREMHEARQELQRLSKGHAVLERMSESLGTCTACVLFTSLGDPHEYHCGAAYRKAMGLNLKECSSGTHQGQLKITKRGPSVVRRWLYFAALRIAQSAAVRPWFEAKKKKDQDRGRGAVVAIMRKLALAVHATVSNEEAFQLGRLLPGKPFVKPVIIAADKTSETVATAAIGQDIKKEDIKKEEVKKEDHAVSRRPKVRLRSLRATLPLPT